MKNILQHKWYEWRTAPPADFAVIGDPIFHSLSPLIHNEVLNYLGLSKAYHAIRVPKLEFNEAIQHLQNLGYTGLNITAPLKEDAYQWAENKDKNLSAYNTLNLKTKKGINTDPLGFYKSLCYKKWHKPCSVLFLGGGATTQSLSSYLGEKKFDIHIFARDLNKIKNWNSYHLLPISLYSKIEPIPIQIIINTLPASQLIHYSLNLSKFPSSTRFYDLNYLSYSDPLYQSIQKKFEYINGLRMLAEQGALSLEWWLKQSIPIHIMLKVLGL